MGKTTLDSLLKERLELLNTMYDCSDKLLVSLQVGDLAAAERYDHLREGCWEQIRYLDSQINQMTRDRKSSSPKTSERFAKEFKTVLRRVRKTSQEIYLFAMQTRNRLVRTFVPKRKEAAITEQPSITTEPTLTPSRPKVAEA
ncbi:MAG TPA: hypothetical protein VJL87_04620 [Bdellovibrionota bacterium]|nr:hypothetical protein [Bdellovibrionota bacterium]